MLHGMGQVSCHGGVAEAIVEVHQQVVVGQGVPESVHEAQQVTPGHKAHVRQAVGAGGESEPTDEKRLEPPCRKAGAEEVVDADEGNGLRIWASSALKKSEQSTAVIWIFYGNPGLLVGGSHAPRNDVEVALTIDKKTAMSSYSALCMG